jgi:hypothetical protein
MESNCQGGRLGAQPCCRTASAILQIGGGRGAQPRSSDPSHNRDRKLKKGDRSRRSHEAGAVRRCGCGALSCTCYSTGEGANAISNGRRPPLNRAAGADVTRRRGTSLPFSSQRLRVLSREGSCKQIPSFAIMADPASRMGSRVSKPKYRLSHDVDVRMSWVTAKRRPSAFPAVAGPTDDRP